LTFLFVIYTYVTSNYYVFGVPTSVHFKFIAYCVLMEAVFKVLLAVTVYRYRIQTCITGSPPQSDP